MHLIANAFCTEHPNCLTATIERLWRAGRTQVAIAQELGISQSQVSRRLRDAGLTISPTAARQRPSQS